MSSSELDDLLDGLGDMTPPKKKVTNERRFRSALDATEAATLSSPKSMAGKRKRVQFFLPPEQHQYILNCSQTEGMGVMEFRSWLIDVALQAYDNGLRPEMDTVVTRKRAKLTHTTSNR
ncbi:MAG: hypothetical protein ACPG8W_17205 [Candidatus Promineifilaceae bacterium]